MMKRLSIVLFTLLFLVSCSSNKDEEIIQEDEQENEQVSIVPSHRLTDDQYKVILPFKASKARGLITDRVENRVDISEMESGLKKHSTEIFDPEKYFFEEGQYLTDEMIRNWTGRKGNKAADENHEIDMEGLNPKISASSEYEASVDELKKNPRYISHILEQNYLIEQDDNVVELGGISLGLAMKSIYSFQNEIGGPSHYKKIPEKELKQKAKQFAEEILQRVRQINGLEDVPILIAVFKEEEKNSAVPGSYILKTSVKKGESKIKKWEEIDEKYVLFPSDESKKDYVKDHQIVNSFGEDIADYFPNYVGVTGEGFYENQDLQTLKLEVPIEFYGQSEVIGFTQYIYGLIQEKFPNHYDLEIEVTSPQGLESLLVRKKGEEEPIVHVTY